MKTLRERNILLTKLAKRKHPDKSFWFDCSLTPQIGNEWECFICDSKFKFKESFLEIDEHGQQHAKDSNLLPFL